MKSIKNEPVNDMVKNIRKIRDEINAEIMHMSFSEECAYLDSLISKGEHKQFQLTTGKKNESKQNLI